MRRLLLASICFALAGCAGSGSGDSAARFAGTWDGVWVNTNDSTDSGTSSWTITRSGVVTGQDVDPGRETTFNVAGNVDVTGMLTSVSTPTGGEPATLNGPLHFDNQGFLTGILTWGVNPPLTYRYTFHRAP